MNDAAFEALDEAECYELLRSNDFGRLAIVVDDAPLIFPVNYAIDENTIVIRTAAGTKFDATSNNAVCFEIDEVDHAHRRIWSVVVVGKSFHAEMLGPHDTHPIVPGDKPMVIRIPVERITGRRLVMSSDAIELDPRGYL